VTLQISTRMNLKIYFPVDPARLVHILVHRHIVSTLASRKIAGDSNSAVSIMILAVTKTQRCTLDNATAALLRDAALWAADIFS
jgi:hypothetical protein